jgi:predicted glycosyltransferase involved in capsule biosynthesis
MSVLWQSFGTGIYSFEFVLVYLDPDPHCLLTCQNWQKKLANTYIKKTQTNQCFHPANYLNDSANNTYIKKTLTNQCFHPANYLNHSANLVKYYLSGFDIFLQKMIVKKLPPSKKRENTVL